MPIYEYQALNPDKGCAKCAGRFEVIQDLAHKPLACCPQCGSEVVKLVSLCRRAVMMECADGGNAVEKRISAYEKEGMWSHAAELADKHSEKTKDSGMRLRAIDNYQKAGYETKTLEKHAKADFASKD